MSISTISLKQLDAENWYTCCELKVTEEQKQFMEPNAVSIVQSKFEPTLKPLAIYDGDTMVGFLMYNSVPEELDAYWIYRIMIDKQFQYKGIGKTASSLMIDHMVSSLQAQKIAVGYHPANQGAHSLYASLGFVDEGLRFGKEMAVVKTIIS